MANKRTLARKLTQKTLLTQKESVQVIEALLEIILEELKSGDEVSLVGFGKFYLYENTPRPVRNPKTQEEMVLHPYKSLRFKQSNVIKKLLKDLSYNEEL